MKLRMTLKDEIWEVSLSITKNDEYSGNVFITNSSFVVYPDFFKHHHKFVSRMMKMTNVKIKPLLPTNFI